MPSPEDVRSWWKFLSEPSHQIWVGLIIAVLFSVLALIALVRRHRTSRTVSLLGSSGVGSSQINDQTPLSDNARLTIAFDSVTPTVVRQEGVRCYHWHSVPNVVIDWRTRNVSELPGYMLIFLEFTNPTCKDHWRVRVENEDIESPIQSTSAAGAVVRVIGDMQGKSIDICFSKDRILD